jgi:hypothetical protein
MSQYGHGFGGNGSGGGGAGFQPGSAGAATSLVELSISGKNLRDMDVFSKSDPMCVVYTQPFGSNSWQEVLRTECIQNNLNPKFTRKVQISYCFEQQQNLKFEMYDIDNPSNNLSDHDFIGRATCTLGQIVTAGGGGSGGHGITLTLSNPDFNGNCGQIIIAAEELSMCKDELELQFMAKKLDRKDWFGSSDPFLQISRSNERPGDFTVVHRTEHINRNCNPVWKQFTIPIRSLCNGDLDRNLKIECFDYNNSGNHSYIGEFATTTRQLMEGPGPTNTYPCINIPKKNRKRSYKDSGKIHLIHSKMQKAFSFLDYVQGGTELACTISIDFTASNGNPQSSDSLHYINPRGMNPYESAIDSVGKIIEDYDSDKLFPVIGFGARLPPDGRVSHEFYVNGHPSNPYCERISGVLSAYRSCINKVQLYGPTNFAPTINHVSKVARNFIDGSQYFILLIVTDGIITDMEQTKSAIVDAALLPISIIIVGVGGADFDAMEELDGDTVRVTDQRGRVASRDIVQFVPMRNFLGIGGPNSQGAGVYLAKEVLAEVPDQFIGFMKSRKIVPKIPHPNASNQSFNLPADPETVINL